jgi:hypothetical protein
LTHFGRFDTRGGCHRISPETGSPPAGASESSTTFQANVD